MEDLLVSEAKRRQEVFKNLPKLLEKMKSVVSDMDENSRVFLFGSVAKNEHVLTSDIDILILTRLKPSEVIARLRREGFDEPFEFHVVDQEAFESYSRLIKELREI